MTDKINPITKTDYPDPDVIRVDDAYFMISTTMYFFPGGVILRSFDLVNWEIYSYIFDKLDDTPSERLEGNENNYGKGMWAATLREHNGKFYVAFVSHGKDDTHLFVADKLEGPWEHKTIKGYYHDCSLIWLDDKKQVFIVHGNTEIRLTELKEDLSGPKEGGIDKVIIKDNKDDVTLGYEGSHIYKINNRFYITLIHWPKYNKRRTESVFVSDNIDGPYEGKDVFYDDLGLKDMGAAQGGLVDTPDGRWYSIVFQDSGAVGRVPVLVPVTWPSDSKFPVFGEEGKVSDRFSLPSKISTRTEPLWASDNFDYEDGQPVLKKVWQFNHVPNRLWEIKDKAFRITTGKISVNPTLAQNTLTQRMHKDKSVASVTVEGKNLNSGDMAGLIALQGCFNFIGILKEDDGFYLIKMVRTSLSNQFKIGSTDFEPGEIIYKEKIDTTSLKLKLSANFKDMVDLIDSFYFDISSKSWKKIASSHKLKFGLDHFTGARFGLCVFSTRQIGGSGEFRDFIYEE